MTFPRDKTIYGEKQYIKIWKLKNVNILIFQVGSNGKDYKSKKKKWKHLPRGTTK